MISGASGMIGTALAQQCAAAGEEVLAICHRASDRNRILREIPGVEVWEADLSEYAGLAGRPWTKKYDTFYHLAWAGTTGQARNDMVLQTDNIRWTLDAVELAHRMGCGVFVGAGSQAEYGRYQEPVGSRPLDSRTPAFPETGYGMAKLCAGQMSRVSCETRGIRHIWARVLSVYGPHGGQDMITMALNKLLRGEHVSFTAGEQIWDYLYSDDAAFAMRLMAEKGITGKTYVLCGGQSRPLKDYLYKMYDIVCEEMRRRGRRAGTIGMGELPYGAGQLMRLSGDITELRRDTGFAAQVSFEEGIRKLLTELMSNAEE